MILVVVPSAAVRKEHQAAKKLRSRHYLVVIRPTSAMPESARRFQPATFQPYLFSSMTSITMPVVSAAKDTNRSDTYTSGAGLLSVERGAMINLCGSF